eukprot:203944-Chlamydomonas_euryale.AAC.1
MSYGGGGAAAGGGGGGAYGGFGSAEDARGAGDARARSAGDCLDVHPPDTWFAVPPDRGPQS